MRRIFWLLALLLFPCLASAATPTAQTVLAQSKAASGGSAWNHVHSIKLQGKASAGGLSGPFEQLEEVSDGASLLKYKLGPYEAQSGFDGSTAWSQGPSGDVALQESAAGKRIAASDAYLSARAYWFPQRWPASIQLLGTRTDDGNTYQVLRILPKGGDAIELWIDTATHLVAKVVEMTGGDGRTQLWSDYRTVDGIKLPFRVEEYTGSDVAHKSVALVDRASINVDFAANTFAPPKQNLQDFTFLDGGNSATIPIEIINNHVYLAVSINGHTLHFIFDTGGRNLLTPQAATKAGVKSVGSFAGGGVGKKVVDQGVARVGEMIVGGKISFRHQTFIVEALPHFDQIEGTKFDGLIGYEVLKRLVVQINYAERKVTFIRPSDFSSVNAGQPIPFAFFGSKPMVKGSLDGLPGQFAVDTGSRAGFTLWTPFVRAHQLVKRYRASPETTIGWGVGGKAVGRVARGGEFLLGGVKIAHPVITMQNAVGSPNSFKGDDGNIGGEILRRFTVTFDYGHHTMYLRPNESFSKPFDYDRSGMWINQGNGGFEVESLVSNGPAAAAGLQVGDVIVSVNGTPASQMTLSGLRQSLREENPGTQIRLAVHRDDVTKTVDLILRKLIPAT